MRRRMRGDLSIARRQNEKITEFGQVTCRLYAWPTDLSSLMDRDVYPILRAAVMKKKKHEVEWETREQKRA